MCCKLQVEGSRDQIFRVEVVAEKYVYKIWGLFRENFPIFSILHLVDEERKEENEDGWLGVHDVSGQLRI